ncbi:MAG: glycosyltransferase [Proteobacteria bacterium]|nr:glycosyltransferase [Pseudomonadota bacterium]
MPICRVAHLIYSPQIGGSEMVAAHVCNNLDRSRFEPMVLFMYRSSGAMPEVLSRLGVPCHSFDMTRLSFLLRPFIVARILNKLQVDVLHVHHIPLYRRVAQGVRLSRVKGVVFTEHAKFSISRTPSLQEACRRAARQVAHFTTVSEDLKNYFVTQLDIPASAIQVILNGVDIKRFRPVNREKVGQKILPSSGGGKIMISVGRLTEAKDQVTLLRAMKLLMQKQINLSLVLVGEGELRPLLEKTIRELDLQKAVFLLGNRTDVDALLPHADLFVLSSRREGLPMVLLEAMACQLPVVSTSVGGIPEVVQDGVNGLLVDPENPEALAAKIAVLLTQPDMASKMGAANRQKVVAEYSMAQTAERYGQLYEQVMAAHAGIR